MTINVAFNLNVVLEETIVRRNVSISVSICHFTIVLFLVIIFKRAREFHQKQKCLFNLGEIEKKFTFWGCMLFRKKSFRLKSIDQSWRTPDRKNHEEGWLRQTLFNNNNAKIYLSGITTIQIPCSELVLRDSLKSEKLLVYFWLSLFSKKSQIYLHCCYCVKNNKWLFYLQFI